jgi:hypothetical protein
MKKGGIVIIVLLLLGTGLSAVGREIHLPGEAAVAGKVIIAEWFYEEIDRDTVIPREFQAWPGPRGIHDSDWFDVRIVAVPGDVIILQPGQYIADLWVFSPGITLRTAGEGDALATVHGSIEVDADRVVLERLAVAGNDGHGFEINREVVRHVTLRGCRSTGNLWVGIHLIGAKGTITEYRIEDCIVQDNGWDGIDVRSTVRFVLTGSTITGNGGAGVFVESYAEAVELADNTITDNDGGQVVYKNSE